MSATASLAKTCAVASTALLMGAYVWFQSKDGDPEVVADTTTGLAVAPTTLPGSQPEALPSSKYAPMVLPGSKKALVFQPGEVAVLPGSKSDDISLLKILPGSKSGKVAIPAEFLKTDEEAAKNLTILPGSKSLAKVIEVDPAKVAAALRKAREAEAKATKRATEKPKKPTFLPGSKFRAPLISPPVKNKAPKPRLLPVPTRKINPEPAKPNPVKPAPTPKKQAFFPGSKSAPIIIIPEGEPKPIPPVPKPPPASKPQPQTQKFLPGSKSSTLLDPTQLKPQAGKEARLRKELEARQRQKAKGPTEK
ncbi:MAG: hypothetical protein VCA38_13190 [Roseibacillus sp.]